MTSLRKPMMAALAGLGALALIGPSAVAAPDTGTAAAYPSVQLAHMSQGPEFSPGMGQPGQGYGTGPGYGMGPCQGYGPGYGMGPGMMGPGYGYGPGYGMGPDMGEQGMMGPGQGYGQAPGYGMGPGMGGQGMMGPGQGYGQGPGYGMGPGMMGPGMMGPGQGYGQAPGYGMGPGMGGQAVAPSKDLSVDDVRHFFEHRIDMSGNKHLKVGDVKASDDDTIVAEIVTQDGSLVQRLNVDRHTGQMRQAE